MAPRQARQPACLLVAAQIGRPRACITRSKNCTMVTTVVQRQTARRIGAAVACLADMVLRWLHHEVVDDHRRLPVYFGRSDWIH